jgi:hypothetical protein
MTATERERARVLEELRKYQVDSGGGGAWREAVVCVFVCVCSFFFFLRCYFGRVCVYLYLCVLIARTWLVLISEVRCVGCGEGAQCV